MSVSNLSQYLSMASRVYNGGRSARKLKMAAGPAGLTVSPPSTSSISFATLARRLRMTATFARPSLPSFRKASILSAKGQLIPLRKVQEIDLVRSPLANSE